MSTESSVSEQGIETEDIGDSSEECIKDAFGTKIITGDGNKNNSMGFFERLETLKNNLRPTGEGGTLLGTQGARGISEATGARGGYMYGVGPNESLSKPEEAFTIDPCGKKNSLDCQQSINQSSSPLVENTNRSLCNEEDNKNSIIDSEECSNRSSNESFVLDNKPYYDRKKKVPSEHISGYNMPDVSFRTWLHKE